MNETLAAIVAEFNRYNRTPRISVESPAAGWRGYDALSFDADDPESFLAVLERDPHLQVERHAERVVIRLK
jgi:transmembrane sensor